LKFTRAQKKRVEGKAETESTEFPRARYLQYNRSQKAQRLEIQIAGGKRLQMNPQLATNLDENMKLKMLEAGSSELDPENTQ